MLAPFAVDHVEQHVALQLAHGAFAADRVDLFFTVGVGTLGVLDQRIEQLFASQLPRLADGVRVDQVVMIDADRVQGLERLPQLLQVPVLGVTLGGGAGDVGGDDVDHHVVRLLLQVLALKDHPALVVDDGALTVHHLVVLEDVLADLEVLLLDLGLCAPDRAGHHLRLDGHVLG